MRTSIVCQRNLSGIFTAPRSSNLIRSLPQNRVLANRIFARSFWRDPSIRRTDLSEIFERIQWPTTKKEEAEVVEGVRTAIWDEQNGGMLRQRLSRVSHCQLTN
jgi:hypothetical protein